MNNYKRGGFKKQGGGFGGRSKFDGGRGRDNRSGGRPPVELFKAECAKCEKSCEVPFRPTTDKPVFCRDCFAKQNAGNERPDRRRDSGSDTSRGGQHQTRYSRPATQHNELAAVQRQMEAITARLDRIIELISSPASLSTLLERAAEAEAETEE